MKKHIKRHIFMLMWFVILILTIGVSYAYFSSTLYISGTARMIGNFEVLFTGASISNQTELESILISDTGDSFTFNVKLALPGESDTINYTIKNNGTIDATIEELNITSVADSDVTFDTSSIAGDLASGESKSGVITVTWNADSVSSQKDVSFSAEIVARQKVS